ncbi:hypothetical protein OCU04_005966 [Sclerotinia nivalis]|uniref:Uncharacterized protein n=1 Tax=Sclerotinia nivalis TaxID=352851 RepID=A0A9X0DKS7_9HELO|nr:hypothetical protein OCU04_005966 [Sclerotinia nivalis]
MNLLVEGKSKRTKYFGYGWEPARSQKIQKLTLGAHIHPYAVDPRIQPLSLGRSTGKLLRFLRSHFAKVVRIVEFCARHFAS